MRKKFPIRLVLVPALIAALVWWFWPSAPQEDLAQKNQSSLGGRGLVSAVQPVGQSLGSSASGDYSAVPVTILDDAAKKKLSADFQRAQQAYEQGNQPRAIEILSQLTIDHPHIIEPYVNLAAAYAANGELEKARLTLNRGVDVNKTYAQLFGNLSKVHGALAANAYRSALDKDEELVTKVELPILNQVSLAPSGEQMMALLQQRESEYQNKLAAVTAQLKQSEESLASTQSDTSDQADSATMIASLQQQLAESQQELAELRNADMTVASLSRGQATSSLLDDEQDSIARQENAVKQQQLLEQQQIAERELAAKRLAEQENARLALLASEQRKEEERKKALAAAQQAEPQQPANVQSGQQSDVAIGLVQSWAEAWSNQNVGGYVSHYQNGYVPPGSSITHATWLKQRQVRLTNKKFINVKVSDFEVQNSGDKFFVTFTQHYQSNTMDDTIRKQLQFKKMGDDWQQAKIIGERVVR